jgi:hypothetical protein
MVPAETIAAISPTPTPIPIPTPTPVPTPVPTARPVHSPAPIGHFNLTGSAKPVDVARELVDAVGGEISVEARTESFTEVEGTFVNFIEAGASSWSIGWGDGGQLHSVQSPAAGTDWQEWQRVIVSDEYLAHVRAILGAAGIPQPTGDPLNDGLSVSWPREEGGIPVSGDGWSVNLSENGDLRSLSYYWHALAPAPAHVITATEALAVVQTECHDPDRDGGCGKPVLEWTSTGWGSDADVLVLCWVIQQHPGWWLVDAGTGKAVFEWAQQ